MLGDNPTLWFAQVESQFRDSGITKESTKFGYVAGALDRRWATQVQDILLNLPAAAQRPYTTLKNELIRRLSLSEDGERDNYSTRPILATGRLRNSFGTSAISSHRRPCKRTSSARCGFNGYLRTFRASCNAA